MSATSIPLHELIGDNSAAVVLDLMAGLITAAQGRRVETLHPAEVVIGQEARVNLMLHRDLPPHPLTSAPELRRTGAGPATLVYAVGAIGALSTLGHLPPAPNDPAGHGPWLRDLCGRLARKWGEGEPAIALIGRCLDRDPVARPSPDALIAEIRDMHLPPDQGLVSLAGALPRSNSNRGNLGRDTPVPALGSPAEWPLILSVVPEVPKGASDRPRVKVRPPRSPTRRRGRRPDVRWAALTIGVVLGVLLLAAGAQVLIAVRLGEEGAPTAPSAPAD